jgi:valyl-tRNA synthetase
MAALDTIELSEEAPEDLHATLVKGRIKAYLVLPGVNVEDERTKLLEELKYARGFVEQIKSKLSNERFVQNAPDAIVDKERKKLEDGEGRVKMLEESLEQLGK